MEKHIRRNALRLNLADRLGDADAPASEISSEVRFLDLAVPVANTALLPSSCLGLLASNVAMQHIASNAGSGLARDSKRLGDRI